MLLDKGLDGQDGFLGKALLAATIRGHEEVVRILLDKGADANFQGLYDNPLQSASWRGFENVIRTLLGARADVNA